MKPDPRFVGLAPAFWAHVKLVSEKVGYSPKRERGSTAPFTLRRFEQKDIAETLTKLKLSTAAYFGTDGSPSVAGQQLIDYLNFRADLLEKEVEPNLMDRDQAKTEFEKLVAAHSPTVKLPKNKQKGEKSHHLYLTCIVNILTEVGLGGIEFDPDPSNLSYVTRDGDLLRTFSRRFDGAYPSYVDPAVIWEIKEHYGTTTFGSRVSGGVYETLLDGMELAEAASGATRAVAHYLFIDDHFTWWVKGRPFLCRVVDAMHQGLVDEVMFGREVLTRWPEIVETWP